MPRYRLIFKSKTTGTDNLNNCIFADVDECVEGLHGCLPEVEECRNTEGAYECDIQCRKGFTFSRSLGICVGKFI